MEVVLDTISNTEALIKINLRQEDYHPKVEEKIKEYSRKARINGFRPGKVPKSLIKKMYGKPILMEEVSHILSQRVTDYIRENKLDILGEPLPNTEKAAAIDWCSQVDFDFEYSIGMPGDFEVELDEEIKIEHYTVTVDDKAIDEAIDSLRKRFGEVTNPEESAEGDNLYGEIVTDGEEENKTSIIDLTRIEESHQKQFYEKKKGDTVAFDASKAIADEAYREEVTGTKDTGKVTFLIKNINRTIEAEIGQDLFDKTFRGDDITTEEEYREKIKEVLSKNYEKESNDYLDHRIEGELVENTKIELPSDFLRRYLKATSEDEEEEVDNEYESYVWDLKWSLIKDKISKDNNFKTEYREVLEEVRNLIRARPDLAEHLEDGIDSLARKYLADKEGSNYIRFHKKVHNDKVLAYIKEHISIENKEVSPEQFYEETAKGYTKITQQRKTIQQSPDKTPSIFNDFSYFCRVTVPTQINHFLQNIRGTSGK